MEIEGSPVLSPYPSSKAKDHAIFPIVYATGPGAATWAPEDPQKGISFFGKALMECLECAEGVKARQDGEQYWITFEQLSQYLEPRVGQLLQEAGSHRQPTRPH